ncbi:hypothetical protein H0S70_06555 [Chryseobacterium manosquense]|uniref:Addiction module protein n=1 Tax=Chryseobacterium manosquense TaxID=2754694 RepID=A0A7H1E045_9FLAO|nr:MULTISPECIES: hypothetical protein [Chryseobacterium group]QNS42603.1 hypothetical protein H0S70_06555 [Chryseobacterium manosquense]
MMSTADLKIDLITQIAGITDKVRLIELMQMLKFESENSPYITNDEEKQIVAEARTQIANGESISNDDFQNEIQKWLNK